MTGAGWPWAGAVTERLARPREAEPALWARLPEWEEAAPRPAPRTVTLDPPHVEQPLAALVQRCRKVRADETGTSSYNNHEGLLDVKA